LRDLRPSSTRRLWVIDIKVIYQSWRFHLEQKAEFYPYIDSVLNDCWECNCVTGDYSMLIEVRFKTTADLDHFVGELQRFGKTKTQIVFSTNVKHRCRYWKNDLHHDEEKK